MYNCPSTSTFLGMFQHHLRQMPSVYSAHSPALCLLTGESSWSKLLLDGLKSHEKQPFLSGYLCASLFYLLKATSSRQKLFADSASQSAVTEACLEAAQSAQSLVRLVDLYLAACLAFFTCLRTPQAARSCLLTARHRLWSLMRS